MGIVDGAHEGQRRDRPHTRLLGEARGLRIHCLGGSPECPVRDSDLLGEFLQGDRHRAHRSGDRRWQRLGHRRGDCSGVRFDTGSPGSSRWKLTTKATESIKWLPAVRLSSVGGDRTRKAAIPRLASSFWGSDPQGQVSRGCRTRGRPQESPCSNGGQATRAMCPYAARARRRGSECFTRRPTPTRCRSNRICPSRGAPGSISRRTGGRRRQRPFAP